MKVAAYQAPLLPIGSMEAVALIRRRIDWCQAAGVEILCCPEGVLGGLADNAPRPQDIAIDVEGGQLAEVLAPLASDQVTTILGFTEAGRDGALYNTAAVWHRGEVAGLYRKVYPAIRQSVYSAGERLPVFQVGDLTFGIVICNDSNFVEPARLIAAQGASALFVPTNNGLRPEKADVVVAARRGGMARAVENSLWVIRADVAGQNDGLVAYGTSSIIDPDGGVVREAKLSSEDMVVADIETVARPRVRGWGADRNPAVAAAYANFLGQR